MRIEQEARSTDRATTPRTAQPLAAKVAVVVEHAVTLAAPAHQLDELDVLQLLFMIRQTAASALPHAVQAAYDTGATPAMVERIVGRTEQTAAVSA